jgi:hypothetical protein
LSHLCKKGIFLPRQARDKHRESTQKRAVFVQEESGFPAPLRARGP